jgi:hypothetical protein
MYEADGGDHERCTNGGSLRVFGRARCGLGGSREEDEEKEETVGR